MKIRNYVRMIFRLKIESRGAEKQGITQTYIQDEIEVVVSSANKGDFT